MKVIKIVYILFFLFIHININAIDLYIPLKSNYTVEDYYPIDLLEFLLDSAGVEYNIIISSKTTTQARDIENLKNQQGTNLLWIGTSVQLEKDLVPIRFPIWRGLLGYRLFIIHKDNQELFTQIDTLDELQQYRGDQGIGWSDIAILEHSGLMQDESQYDLIFRKIQKQRTDYFSRGISEIFKEVENRQGTYPDLHVDQHLLLIYPFAGFFFTNKENQKIADILEKSFKDTYDDGSFQEFFYNHRAIDKIIQQSNMENRVRIHIPNPFLSRETSLIDKSYWHSLE